MLEMRQGDTSRVNQVPMSGRKEDASDQRHTRNSSQEKELVEAKRKSE
jgi:hypothetical protein